MVSIRLENLHKDFGGSVVAVDNLSLTFDEGSTTCLLGPSGCGKTTLMRMIAGLETQTSGRIFFDDLDVTKLKTRKRDLGMVFQYPVVYQGTTIRQNIGIPLRRENMTTAEKNERVDEILDLLGLSDVANTDVGNLDYATKQKVAVARAISRRPPIVLFDEPITNVDLTAKLQLKLVLKELFTKLKQTVLYVTHDQTEAMTLADKIALMRDGRVEQLASPRELYTNSQSVFAGRFLGNPGMNFLGKNDSSEIIAQLLGNRYTEQVSSVGFRPEDVVVSTDQTPGAVPAEIEHVAIVTGGQHLVTLKSGVRIVKAKLPWHVPFTKTDGEHVWWSVPETKVRAFDSAEQLVPSGAVAVGS